MGGAAATLTEALNTLLRHVRMEGGKEERGREAMEEEYEALLAVAKVLQWSVNCVVYCIRILCIIYTLYMYSICTVRVQVCTCTVYVLYVYSVCVSKYENLHVYIQYV